MGTNMKRITVLGAGISGCSLAGLGRRKGFEVFLSEKNDIPVHIMEELDAQGVRFESGGHSEEMYTSDLIVVSSGISPSVPELIEADRRGLPLMGELDFVYPYLKGRCIAVTGSNGKTTTTLLIGHLLASMGARVAVAGNIGTPLAQVAEKTWDYIVMELSSFQLHWSRLFQADISVITNLAPDHIDWHGSCDAYFAAKLKLLNNAAKGKTVLMQGRDLSFEGQKCTDTVYGLTWREPSTSFFRPTVILDEVQQRALLFSENEKITLFDFEDVSLLGRHNLENAAMASSVLALCGYNPLEYRKKITDFMVPPHRCELVAEQYGIRYINDSKGTNVAAAITALTSLPGKKCIILGGKGKGEEYSHLVTALKDHARWAVLMGEEKKNLALALTSGGYFNFSEAQGMKEAVEIASEMALSGDVVLLSPACTSWDYYRNYEERGQHFCQTVRSILNENLEML